MLFGAAKARQAGKLPKKLLGGPFKRVQKTWMFDLIERLPSNWTPLWKSESQNSDFELESLNCLQISRNKPTDQLVALSLDTWTGKRTQRELFCCCWIDHSSIVEFIHLEFHCGGFNAPKWSACYRRLFDGWPLLFLNRRRLKWCSVNTKTVWRARIEYKIEKQLTSISAN